MKTLRNFIIALIIGLSSTAALAEVVVVCDSNGNCEPVVIIR